MGVRAQRASLSRNSLVRIVLNLKVGGPGGI